MCLEDQCVSSLQCIQHSLFQILPHLFKPLILREVMMNSSKFAYNLCGTIMLHWHQKWPCWRGNVIVEVPHTITAEQGGPSNHKHPIHKTILARNISTPPLQALVNVHTNNMLILFHTYMHPYCPFSSLHTILSRWLLSSFK